MHCEFAGALLALADDQAIHRLLLERLLANGGMRLLSAESGSALLAELDGSSEIPELVFLDLHMPDLDGWATLHALRTRGWSMPVIALSGEVLSERACLDSGFADALCKPLDIDELWGVLTRWLPPRTPTGPLAAPVPTTSTASRLPDWLKSPALDGHQALNRFLGDELVLQRALSAFVQQQAGVSERIALARTQEDFTRISALAHALYGGAANLAAGPLADAARQLEHSPAAAASSQWEAIIRHELTALRCMLAASPLPPPAVTANC